MAAERPPPLPAWLAVVTVLKGMIGTGILGLPYASGQVRLGLAAPGLVATAFIGAFSVWRLIECKAFIASRTFVVSSPTGEGSSEDPEGTLGLGPLALVARRAFGTLGVAVAGFGIIASQLGFAVSYVDVIVETLSQASLLGPYLAPAVLRVALCVVLCLLCLLRRLSSLAWLSGAALLIYLYLLFALLYYGGGTLANGSAPEFADAWLPVRWDRFGSWFGSAIFAQEAIVISQYVYDDMQLPHHSDFLPVLGASFGISGLLFTFVGIFGYLCYGDAIQNVFYLNFPAGSLAVSIGEVVLCLVLLLSFALQMYPVMSFLEATVLDIRPLGEGEVLASSEGEGSQEEEENADTSYDEPSSDSSPKAGPRAGGGEASVVLRCSAVVFTCVAAALVPDLSCVTGYSGCFAMSSIGFFLPPLCHARLRPGSLTLSERLGNAMLLLAGCAAVFFGVLSTSCD
mmetsp:Transcript_105194/g.267257  ORF Transcript_105194/g.267257 Transcript_105194/m.267257 type:complete len:457 (-) Transcript_105194:65-1435(-)|eukprot:CAMPEP_0183533112 /NCGR_PEP_ID=MMETSP0371-20130417/25964_1 /TAXON_ID=268820 /ORGANISM="Peridinium aciculiferum, Strain PAER-2" /LENGTH=456 /DNA_ID=CAMNT_0025733317 /DNA_START=12 /DNA_END=1382 /DNA_ORIENTATION=+